MTTSPNGRRDEPKIPAATSTTTHLGVATIEPVPADDLTALIEALLLIAPSPTTLDELADACGVSVGDIERALAEITMRQQTHGGWVLQRDKNGLRLTTVPRFAPYVRRFLGLDREARLSPAALETLAIIAYQQPVTRSEIEAIRGVDCSGVLAKLHSRELIEQIGRRTTPGQPIEYGSTSVFLRHFGLSSLADLPPLGNVGERDAAETLAAVVAEASVGDVEDQPRDPDASNGADD